VQVRMVGILDRYGESGELKSLFKKYHLTTKDIVDSAEAIIKDSK